VLTVARLRPSASSGVLGASQAQPPYACEAKKNHDAGAYFERGRVPLIRQGRLEPKPGKQPVGPRRHNPASADVGRRFADVIDAELDEPDDNEEDEQSANRAANAVGEQRHSPDCPPASGLPQAVRLALAAPGIVSVYERHETRPAAFVIIVRRSFGYLATLEVEADFLSRLGETTQVGARRLHALGLKVE
jgi:hypothetical protein